MPLIKMSDILQELWPTTDRYFVCGVGVEAEPTIDGRRRVTRELGELEAELPTREMALTCLHHAHMIAARGADPIIEIKRFTDFP